MENEKDEFIANLRILMRDLHSDLVNASEIGEIVIFNKIALILQIKHEYIFIRDNINGK